MPRRTRRAPARGRGLGNLFNTVKKSGVISGLASHIPLIGPVVGGLLSAFGLGRKGTRRPRRTGVGRGSFFPSDNLSVVRM